MNACSWSVDDRKTTNVIVCFLHEQRYCAVGHADISRYRSAGLIALPNIAVQMRSGDGDLENWNKFA